MSWEVKDRWLDSVSKADGLSRPVEVLGPEVVAAEPGPLGSHEALDPHGVLPLPLPMNVFGKTVESDPPGPGLSVPLVGATIGGAAVRHRPLVGLAPASLLENIPHSLNSDVFNAVKCLVSQRQVRRFVKKTNSLETGREVSELFYF